MDKFGILRSSYIRALRPYLFSMEAEKANDKLIYLGEKLENNEKLLEAIFSYKNDNLKRHLLGVNFENPIGLAAGLDYDGHLAKTMKHIGFGFNTIGTVTAKPYVGNTPPRIVRLIKSRSLLVNKGFKSDGAIIVAKRLDKKNLKNHVIGISVGNSNIPTVNTLNKAIDDYLFTFDQFRKRQYVKYFELNISCPNIAIREAFKSVKNTERLIKEIKRLKLQQPILMKMHNEIDFNESDKIVKMCIQNGIHGFIFSNLIGDRQNPDLNKNEVEEIRNLKGGLSGKPTFKGSNKLIAHTRKKFGSDVVIIGCGGVFNYTDTLLKLESGADLIQLVTGLIFEGPQIAGEINYRLSKEAS